MKSCKKGHRSKRVCAGACRRIGPTGLPKRASGGFGSKGFFRHVGRNGEGRWITSIDRHR